MADIEKAGKELIPFLHVDSDTPDNFYLDALKGADCDRMAIVGCQDLKIVPAERIEPLKKAIRKVQDQELTEELYLQIGTLFDRDVVWD